MEYHLYCLDHGGKSVEAQLITAESDEDAVAQARALKGLRQCEVWRDNRLIAQVTFEASPD
jgi:hypothetical protein